MEKLSADDFAKMIVKFTKALSQNQSGTELVSKQSIVLDDQEQIVELFRIWFIDCREQEMISEARNVQETDPYGAGGY